MSEGDNSTKLQETVGVEPTEGDVKAGVAQFRELVANADDLRQILSSQEAHDVQGQISGWRCLDCPERKRY